jgi:serine/threonine protein kinase
MIKADENICSKLNLEKPELIGIGMIGRVYKAYDKNTSEVCCVKIIPSDKFKKEEFEISEKLKNKNNENLIIYSSKEEFKDFKLIALIMEYMDEGDLKSYIDNHNGYFSSKEIFNLIKQICLNIIIIITKYILYLICSTWSLCNS